MIESNYTHTMFYFRQSFISIFQFIQQVVGNIHIAIAHPIRWDPIRLLYCNIKQIECVCSPMNNISVCISQTDCL